VSEEGSRRRRNARRARQRRVGGRSGAADGGIVSGRRAVAESLRADRVSEVLVVSSPKVTQGLRAALDAARAAGVPVRTVPRATLDALAD
jgi:tRNA G18 (ribose-2'-O)-methylase SpoU